MLLMAVAALFLTAPYHKDMWWSDAPRHAMDGAFYSDFARHMPLGHVKQFAMNYYLKYPALTILLMTGYADQRERAHGLDAIIHDVIAKPFSVTTLRGAVTEALTVRARN